MRRAVAGCCALLAAACGGSGTVPAGGRGGGGDAGPAVGPSRVGQTSIVVQVNGQGSVASNPNGIDCGGTCQANFTTAVDLLPNARTGWKFDGWGGACTGPGACHFATPGSADVAVTVFATFVVMPPAADCAGIMPSRLGPAVTATLPGDSCENATSDGSGNVAADVAGRWFVFSPAGARLADYVAESAIPQERGFQGVEPRGHTSTLALVMRSPEGKVLAETGVGGTAAKAFRASDGGSVVISPICGGTRPGGIEVDRFDADGKLSSRGSIPGGCNGGLVGGVGDARGSTFVLLAGGKNVGLTYDVAGRWVDATGQSPLGFFPVMASGSPQRSVVRALIDGEIAVQLDGVWFATTASGGTRAFPVPPWLGDNADHDLTIVRSRRAYAVLSRGAGDPNTMTIYSASGSRCGTLTFPVGGLTAGADGTVIGASGAGGCTKTWWSGLLR